MKCKDVLEVGTPLDAIFFFFREKETDYTFIKNIHEFSTSKIDGKSAVQLSTTVVYKVKERVSFVDSGFLQNEFPVDFILHKMEIIFLHIISS